MSIAILNTGQQQKLVHWLGIMASILTSRLAKMTFSSWCEFRKDKYLLSASYRRYAMSGAIPKRVWNRRSALLAAKKGSLDRY